MLLNSKYSNFTFSFPKKWFYDDIYEKYDIFFKRNGIPYRNLDDYMSYTVQSVSWPAFSAEVAKQNKRGKEITYKSGANFINNIAKELRVTFRTTEGFLNYMVMFDQLQYYWARWENDTTYMKNFMINILDQRGHLTMSMLIEDVSFIGLSELELSFSSNIPEYRTFEATFAFNNIQYIKQED